MSQKDGMLKFAEADFPSSPNAVYRPIREKILSGELPNGDRLPSVRKLAKLFGLPIRTVLTGLDLLVGNGLAEKRPRSGVYVKSDRMPRKKESPIGIAAPRTKAQRIADHIADDIVTGNLRAGEYLPPRKALAFRYKSSTQTIRMALNIVSEKGLIHLQGHNYLAGPAMSPVAHMANEVAVVSAKSSPPGSLGPFWNEFFSAFESELGRYGMKISIRQRRDSRGGKLAEGLKTPHTRGYLFPASAYWMESIVANDSRKLVQELQKLNNLGEPVVLHNGVRILAAFPHQSFNRYKNLVVFARDNVEVGECLGKHLAANGHRTVCFFSYTNYHWNDLRLTGLMKGMKRAWGEGACFHPFQMNVDPQKIIKHVRMVSDSEGGHIERVVNQLIPGPRLSKVNPATRTFSFFHQLLYQEYRQRIMRPVFMKAMAHEDATAWVCADPLIAGLAEAYLRERGIRVPKEMSLACMDDDENASFARITCVELPIRREGYLAAHALLGDLPIKRDRRGLVRCASRIIERGSVARV